MGGPKKRDWTTISEEEARKAIINAQTFKEALNNLQYDGKNSHYNQIIKDLSTKFNISLDHFKQNAIKPGTVFGNWTVLSLSDQTDSSKNRYYLCKCTCGKEKIVMGGNLKRGLSTSCGCIAAQKAKEQNSLDLTGKIFTNLTILNIDQDSYNSSGVNLWNCKCKCGQICKVKTSDLVSGKRIDCGNHTYERLAERREDLSNKTFGLLTVLYPIFENHKTYWVCKCECGRETKVTSGHLKSGHTQTCGLCTRSLGEKQVEKILTELNINFIAQKRFEDLRGKNGVKLSFDFYLSDLNILIECQGLQHYKSIEYYGGEERFNRQIINDNLKREYCKKNNIKLVEIRYDDYDKINAQYILDKINNADN